MSLAHISEITTSAGFLPGEDITTAAPRVCLACGEPEQQDITLSGFGRRRMPRNCKCRRDEYAAEDMRNARAEIEKRVARLRRLGITDSAYRTWTFENDTGKNPQLARIAHAYVDKWDEIRRENIGLIITGGVGTGKTFAACCIANALLDKGISAAVTSFPALLAADLDEAHEIRNFALLVIDDLGTERNTSYGLERVYEIVDARYRGAKPVIFTTNLSLEQLKSPNELHLERAYDRILQMCRPVLASGKSIRKELRAEKYDTFDALLREAQV